MQPNMKLNLPRAIKMKLNKINKRLEIDVNYTDIVYTRSYTKYDGIIYLSL